jgi:hypothetical protein
MPGRRLVLDGVTVVLRESTYYNGNRAFWFEDAETGEPFLTLSVNIDHVLGPGEFTVKDWSENAPYVAAVLAAGWFEDTGRTIGTGFVSAPVWRVKEG